ncbi:hypothetical protein HDV57DRAFT_466251 [Trichoderma longibrachiatum]
MGEASRLGKKGRSLTARHSVFSLGIVGLALKLRIVLTWMVCCSLSFFGYYSFPYPLAKSFAPLQMLFTLLVTRFCSPRRDRECRMHVRWNWNGSSRRGKKTHGYFSSSDTGDMALGSLLFFLLLIPMDRMNWGSVTGLPSGVDRQRGTSPRWSGSEQPGRMVF